MGSQALHRYTAIINQYYDIMQAKRYDQPHSLIIDFPPALEKVLGEEASRALIDYLNQRYEVSGEYQKSPECDKQSHKTRQQ